MISLLRITDAGIADAASPRAAFLKNDLLVAIIRN
jgi:hypothetical protein